jgi:hypothetical protein
MDSSDDGIMLCLCKSVWTAIFYDGTESAGAVTWRPTTNLRIQAQGGPACISALPDQLITSVAAMEMMNENQH